MSSTAFGEKLLDRKGERGISMACSFLSSVFRLRILYSSMLEGKEKEKDQVR